MKNSIFLLLIAFLSFQTKATIYRVGYTGFHLPGTDFAYNDFQTAVNTASAFDTIQVYQQTATTTNGASINKPLHIIGFGHTLNVNTGLQVVNKPDSIFNSTALTLEPGAEGAFVEGLNLHEVNIHVGEVTITRCRFRKGVYDAGYVPCYGGGNLFAPMSNGESIRIHLGGWYYGTGDLLNITINGCYFDGWNNGHPIRVYNNNNAFKVQNLTITNNYFMDQLLLKTNIPGQVNGVFTNNIVNHKFRKLWNINSGNSNVCSEGYFTGCYWYCASSGDNMQSQFDQFLIKNNIFNTADTVTWPLDGQTSIVQNNIFSCASQYAGYTLGGSNNVFKATMSNVFGPQWNDGLVYNDNQLALGSSSPAINAGVKYNNSATNCGIFGGETDQDYKLSGIPNVPAFYQLSTPGVNATSDPYNVTISVRSNK